MCLFFAGGVQRGEGGGGELGTLVVCVMFIISTCKYCLLFLDCKQLLCFLVVDFNCLLR